MDGGHTLSSRVIKKEFAFLWFGVCVRLSMVKIFRVVFTWWLLSREEDLVMNGICFAFGSDSVCVDSVQYRDE